MVGIILPTEAETLYFGFDESNHTGQNKKGEIVVVLVSSDVNDSFVQNYPNHRENVEFVMSGGGQYDYRFTILMGDKYRYHSSSTTLAENAFFLTKPFIHEKLKCIKLYFDGPILRWQKEFIRDQFSGIEKVIVDNFTKKQKINNINTRKGPKCPRVVYLADSLANRLYNTPTGELLSHPKFIPRS